MGAEKFLDAEDIVEICDKKSIIVYLSEVYNKLKEADRLNPKFVASAEWTRNYEHKKKMAKYAEWKAAYAQLISP